MSKIISIDELQEGFVLKNSIMNKFGQILLKEGSVLKLSHIKMFKLWGIVCLTIESDDDNNIGDIDNTIYCQAERMINQKMVWSSRNNNEEELKVLFINILSRFLVSGEQCQ